MPDYRSRNEGARVTLPWCSPDGKPLKGIIEDIFPGCDAPAITVILDDGWAVRLSLEVRGLVEPAAALPPTPPAPEEAP